MKRGVWGYRSREYCTRHPISLLPFLLVSSTSTNVRKAYFASRFTAEWFLLPISSEESFYSATNFQIQNAIFRPSIIKWFFFQNIAFFISSPLRNEIADNKKWRERENIEFLFTPSNFHSHFFRLFNNPQYPGELQPLPEPKVSEHIGIYPSKTTNTNIRIPTHMVTNIYRI